MLSPVKALFLLVVLLVCACGSQKKYYMSTGQFYTQFSKTPEKYRAYMVSLYLHKDSFEAIRHTFEGNEVTQVTFSDKKNKTYSGTVLKITDVNFITYDEVNMHFMLNTVVISDSTVYGSKSNENFIPGKPIPLREIKTIELQQILPLPTQ